MTIRVKKIWIVLSVILIIFIALNPGINRFKEYSGLIGKKSEYIRRNYNFLIFSIYEDTHSDKKYLGILMNFFNITIENTANETYEDRHLDTTTTQIEVKPEFDPNKPYKSVDDLPPLPKGLILDKKTKPDTSNDLPIFLKEK